MNDRYGALGALLIAVAVLAAATTGVAATALANATPDSPKLLAWPSDGPAILVARGRLAERGAVLSGTPSPTAEPAPEPTAEPAAAPTEVIGIASNYPGTAGWSGQATVALPGDLGGRYTGVVNGHVTVCADRCARLPVVDWCQCHWGTDDERVVDLSHAAWPLVSDVPLERGLVEVRLVLER